MCENCDFDVPVNILTPLYVHCKNSGVVVTPNWGVSELCTSDTPWGVMIL